MNKKRYAVNNAILTDILSNGFCIRECTTLREAVKESYRILRWSSSKNKDNVVLYILKDNEYYCMMTYFKGLLITITQNGNVAILKELV